MRMNQNKQIVLVLVVLALAVIGGSMLFSVTGTPEPTCVFTESNKTCVVEYSLSEERAVSSLTYSFDFDAVPDPELRGTQTVTHTSSATMYKESSREKYYYTYYLYSVPEWDEVYDVVINAQGTHSVTCSVATTRSRTGFGINTVTRPWSGQTVVVNQREREINDATLTNTTHLLTDNRYTYTVFYERNQLAIGGLQTARCYRGSTDPTSVTEVGPYDVTTVIPNQYVFGKTDTRFMIYNYRNPESSNTAIVDIPRVTVSYHRALYPSNVKYSVGSLTVETLSGSRRNTTSSLDIADQINIECNRGVSVAACKVNLTITSDTPGKLWLTKSNEVFKVATQSAVIVELESTLAQKIAYINQLDANIEEKAIIIQQLSATQQEQIELIDALNLSISEQASVINKLSKNLEEKAFYVSQLQAENAEQAALIKAMQESFTNQGGILGKLNNTIEEDAYFIGVLASNNQEQAQIIAGMKSSLEREQTLVSELRNTVEEQEELIALIRSEQSGAKNFAFLMIGLAVLALVGAVVYARRKK